MTGAKNDIDFPPMLIYSLPTPFWLDRPIDHQLMEKTISEGLQKLERCGVGFIAMPCNTAHLYFSTLQASIGVPLLNIIDVTLHAIPRLVKKVAIVGTRPTVDSQLFQTGLKEAGLAYVHYPHWQQKIDTMILSVKRESDIQTALGFWEGLARDFLQEGVDAILLVCTDLNVIFKNTSVPFHIIDSASCLAKSIVHQWLQFKNS
jgi:aspartate racemase